jgi:DNA-binding transcriptional LysR family regulator
MRRALDTTLLQTLVAIADNGGFARAGERVNLSQPTVSQQMRRLEEQVGVALFVRKGRAMALTEEGLSLLRYARRILALSDEALSEIAGVDISGPVRLGAIQDLTEDLLSEVLARFSRSHPRVRLEVTVGNSQELGAGLEAGRLDLALLAGTPSQRTPLFRREQLVWIGRDDGLVPPDGVIPLVLCAEPCRLRDTAIALLDAGGQPWRLAFSSPSLPGVKAAVRAGLGITLRGTSLLGPGLAVYNGSWAVSLPRPRPKHLNIVLGRSRAPLPAAARALDALIGKLAVGQAQASAEGIAERLV